MGLKFSVLAARTLGPQIVASCNLPTWCAATWGW